MCASPSSPTATSSDKEHWCSLLFGFPLQDSTARDPCISCWLQQCPSVHMDHYKHQESTRTSQRHLNKEHDGVRICTSLCGNEHAIHTHKAKNCYSHGHSPQGSALNDSPSQSLPPLAGTGLLHDLVKFRIPPPQVTGQGTTSFQGDQPPSIFSRATNTCAYHTLLNQK